MANGAVHARIAFPEGMDVTLFVSRLLPDALIFDGPLPTTSSPPPTSLQPTSSSTIKSTTGSHPCVAADDDNDVPPAPPLPTPLPPRAFARVRPDAWLPIMSAPTAPRRDWDEQGSKTLRITAWFSDVPLEVLPGREREFRSFVSKVIFGPEEGAVAGVQGVAAVGVRVDGLSIGQKSNADGDKDGDGGLVGGGKVGDEDEGVNRTGMVLTGLPFQGSVRIGRKGAH